MVAHKFVPSKVDASGYEFPSNSLLQEPPERVGEIMLIGLAAVFLLGVRDRFALIGFGLCLFVLGTIIQEFTRGMRHGALRARRNE